MTQTNLLAVVPRGGKVAVLNFEEFRKPNSSNTFRKVRVALRFVRFASGRSGGPADRFG